MSETHETLEPIVVTEEKELDVPEFTKKQVEAIVQFAIDHNIIKLPRCPDELPSTQGASVGQILGLDEDKLPEWTDNLKPIYCHPIRIGYSNVEYKSGKYLTGIIGMLIFTNDETPFTFSTFIAYLWNCMQNVNESITIITTGGCIATNDDNNDGHPTILMGLTLNKGASQLQLIGLSQSATLASTSNAIIIAKGTNFSNAVEPTTFIDGVNKIN